MPTDGPASWAIPAVLLLALTLRLARTTGPLPLNPPPSLSPARTGFSLYVDQVHFHPGLNTNHQSGHTGSREEPGTNCLNWCDRKEPACLRWETGRSSVWQGKYFTSILFGIG